MSGSEHLIVASIIPEEDLDVAIRSSVEVEHICADIIISCTDIFRSTSIDIECRSSNHGTVHKIN